MNPSTLTANRIDPVTISAVPDEPTPDAARVGRDKAAGTAAPGKCG